VSDPRQRVIGTRVVAGAVLTNEEQAQPSYLTGKLLRGAPQPPEQPRTPRRCACEKRLHAAIFALIGAFAGTAFGQSDDCANAMSQSAMNGCADRALRAADTALADA